MLGLYPEDNYEPQMLLIGGQSERASSTELFRAGSRASHALKLQWNATSRNYTFTGWVAEPLNFPRLMGDSVLLPNNQVVLLNGAELGLAGDAAKGGYNRAGNPVFHAELYNPSAPRG